MSYCSHCGAEIRPEAVICVNCGCSVNNQSPVAPAPAKDDSLSTIAKIFLILGCVGQGWMLLPLAWCLPITLSIFKSLRENRPISTGMKVCALLFVNLIGGILLLCMNDNQN